MEQPSTEIIVKSLSLLNHLYKNNILNKDTYETILPTIDKKTYNFVILRIYKNLLAFLNSKKRRKRRRKEEEEDLHFEEFFNIEKEKHYQEYIKLLSAYDNYPPFLL